MVIRHLSINVSGRVQGVWFRKSTLEKALDLGLTGTVENLSDNTVQIEAEGSKEKLEELLNWCKDGPEHAEVDEVKSAENEIVGYKDFSIS